MKADGIRLRCIWRVSSGSSIVMRRSIASDSTSAFGGGAAVLQRLHADRSADIRPGAGGEGAAGAAQTPVVLDARTPLVTIDYTVPSPDYGDLLHAAVRAAESRDADVQYDVVSMLPDASDIRQGQERATGVMRAIMRDRVPASRIHLGLRTDPTLASSQVRVYVR